MSTTPPLRVLYVFCGASKDTIGGIEKLQAEFIRLLDPDKVHCDILSLSEQPQKILEDICATHHSRLFVYPLAHKKLRKIKILLLLPATIYTFFKHHHYDICHLNGASYYIPVLIMLAAWLAGVPRRIFHAHNSYVERGSALKYPVYSILKNILPVLSTDYLACSRSAARCFFPRGSLDAGKVVLINNGIETAHYAFCAARRTSVRKALHLQGHFVIGHVGRFAAPKNHTFLLEIFREVHVRDPKARLVLCGTGELLPAMRQKAAMLRLEEAVLFLGSRNDIPDLLQGMDVFVLPSLYEGLPLVAVEAQTADLPCLLASAITPETRLTERCEFLPLDAGPTAWAKRILALKDTAPRRDRGADIRHAGYHIHDTVQTLQSFYLSRTRR